MLTIQTKAVYSKPAGPELMREAGIELPEAYTTLSQHQALTLKYLRDPEIDVIFNTAMTGDGKSLAAYLPVLKAENPEDSVLAMYPTKALIFDQMAQVKKYQQDFHARKSVDYMDADRLDDLMNLEWIDRRSDAIREAINAEILLTNPDIFHYIMSFKYQDFGKTAEHLVAKIIQYYKTYVFDEFHVFQVPQVVAVLNAMLFIYHQTRNQIRRKFLFLSATPHPMLCEKLRRSGMRYEIITGEYRHADEAIPGWRKILNSTTINLVKSGDGASIEDWVRKNLQQILDFYQRNPGAKGAIIVNSPMTAKRLKRYFQELAETGTSPLSVAENTGLTKDQDSFVKDLLIGTSTVDIGVDFEINLLIFESLDQGTFIQRLGRLGRHNGYYKHGTFIPFTEFIAYAMLPRYGYERFETNLNGRSELTREELLDLIKGEGPGNQKAVFIQATDFAAYTKRWGVLQTAHVLHKVKHEVKSQQQFAQELEKAYNAVFDVEMDAVIKRYYAVINADDGKAQFKELMSFRGTSPFDCGVYDATDQTVKTYNIFQILANTHCQPLSKEEFLEKLAQRDIPPSRYEYVSLYVQVNAYHDERENFTLKLRKDLSDCSKDYFHKVIVIKGFFVDVRNAWMNDINRILRKQPVVCILSRLNREEIKRKYRLPPLFNVYKVLDEEGSEYSAAFGKEALLLETILQHVKTESEFWIV
ncbi:DEAD/DEAH box helicase-like protein [Candidatus Vecturithrix granuli]|uniref:DEAD/DEAH box helicase-like protein n=1 Tax=Vecturithrix granuli TaxID=1499967 RepID=A0A081CA92_VECG1|nr:DEAD/DEAH box helicase-like protein [Candidatus Vecturithrix granuli]